MTRRSMTKKRRASIFLRAGGVCHICGDKIDGVREDWHADHISPLEVSGDDGDDNLAPAHVRCHKAKTKDDMRVIVKCRRVAKKHQSKKKEGKIPYRRFDGTAVYPDRRR